MNVLTKYDVLVYLSNETQLDKLIRQIRQNALFGKTSERKIRLLLAELRKGGLVSKNKEALGLTDKAVDTLAFILWAKKDNLDYNVPFKKGNEQLFQKIF